MTEILLDCSRCGEDKPQSEFYKRSKAKRGYAPWCKECHKEYDRERYRGLDKKRKSDNTRIIYERNFDFVMTYLLQNPCIICNESDIVVLDFDHRDETTKKYNVSEMLWSHSIENISNEISKCDILCSNCHRKRTSIQFGWRRAMVFNNNK